MRVSLFLSLRSATVGGNVIDPICLEGDGTASPPMLVKRSDTEFARRVSGNDVLLGTHGFNVNYVDGACSLGHLDAALAFARSELFVGVLWPGDWWLPAVNYPFAGDVSIQSGRKLAAYCNKTLAGARSLSFMSHSLGGRLILEAVEHLNRPARVVCLTAAAVNDDCLSTEYVQSARNALATANLASHKDTVLQIAFPVGDVIANILHLDHAFGEPALGRSGPETPYSPTVVPVEIPDDANYNHGDYLPPSMPGPIAAGKWTNVAEFVARAFRGERQTWP